MKLILTLSVFVLYTVHALPTGDDTPSSHQRIHETGPFQSIRKTGYSLAPAGRRFGSGDSPADTLCAFNCLSEMKANQQRNSPNNEQQQGSTTGLEYNPETLNNDCRVHDTNKACLDRCQNSEAKTSMTNAFGIMQYMCHDSTFKQNAACLHEVSKTTNATCNAPTKCGQYNQKAGNSPADVDGFKNMLKATCQYMKCDLDCKKPTVVQKCGQSAQNDAEGLATKAAEFFKIMAESIGLGSSYPRECDRVAA